MLNRVSAVPGLPHLNARSAYWYWPGGRSAIGILTVVGPTALPLALATGLPVVASRIVQLVAAGQAAREPGLRACRVASRTGR